MGVFVAGRAARRSLALFLAVGLLALVACGQAPAPESGGGAPAPAGEEASGYVLAGKLEAAQVCDLVAKVPGRVAEVRVDVGSVVEKGQVLLVLEGRELAERVKQAEAGVAQAEAALAAAKAAAQALDAALEAAKGNLAVAQANYEVAAANYERGKQLYEAGAISEAVFQAEYTLRYKQAREQAEVVGPAQVRQLQEQRRQAENALEQARAGLKTAQANLALARLAYEDTLIKSPIRGVVTARNVDPGEVAGSAVPVLTVADTTTLYVRAAAPPEKLGLLREGMRVKVRVPAVGGEAREGEVVSLAPAADPGSKAYAVKVRLAATPGLKPGMYAEVLLPQPKKDGGGV